MRYTNLGQTDLRVSQLCLGSMTWGSQDSEQEGHAQIDLSLEHGINFIDTAEMYPVNPVLAERCGRTETIIGNWFARTGRRDDVVLATKIVGPNGGFLRDGEGITPETVRGAVDGSLKRLQTDYIDLYQLHWPNRGSYHFRQNWEYDPSAQDRGQTLADIEAILVTLQELIEAGKIRHIGLSNETAWGTAQWLRLSDQLGLPRMQSIQNEYSLMCRQYDTDLGELGHNEQVTLLAFSPLAAGMLSGKYQGDVTPAGSRREVNANLSGRLGPRALDAVQAYLDIAKKHGLDPVQMANAFVLSRPFPAVSIFGARSINQLKQVLPAGDLVLSDEVLADISAAHRAHPMPY
ncbi:aldo/keto reductase [Actibacterium pelagium]|uniref:NADP-dependent oxidoreductase n=1 Tax=Actibacterium pelagium TaxID=2029103 RepID=A0A917ANB6_9RHOB|nr:aldo/keto reductase [Actibacterium pelagium]GGE59829.1 NADP-dependent oxidoreductase [Actibacterium pelagium]